MEFNSLTIHALRVLYHIHTARTQGDCAVSLSSHEWCSHARPYCGRPAKLQGACCLRLRPVEQLHPPLREARTLVSLETCEVGCAVVRATLQIVA